MMKSGLGVKRGGLGRRGWQMVATAAAVAACQSFARAGLGFDDLSPFEDGNSAAQISATAANDTFIGGAVTLAPGTTNITGLDLVGENLTSTAFTSAEITIYIWGTVNTGTVSATNPAFSNLLFSGSLISSDAVPAYNASSGQAGIIDEEYDPGVIPGIGFNEPIQIPNASTSGSTTIGITVSFAGAVGGSTTSYATVTGLTSLLTDGAAPSVGSDPLNGFYRNNATETNGNFVSPLRNINNNSYLNLAARVYSEGTYNWNSSTGGNWEDATKWNTGVEPIATDDAVFNLSSTTGYTVGVNSTYDVCNNMTVESDNVTIALSSTTSQLTIFSTLTVGQPPSATSTGTTVGTLNLTTPAFGNAFVATNAVVIGSNGATGHLTVGPNVVLQNNLNVSVGALSTLTLGDGAILLTSGIQLAGTTNNWTAKLDITTGAIDLPANDIVSATNQVRQGYNLTGGGNWNGSGGITSSTAAADTSHLTAVGVIQNNQGGSPIYGNPNSSTLPAFGVFYPGASDVLIRYTYYGDANLDGVVDGSDYSLIDAGYASKGTLTGWYNGDFNYDGVIDGSDYALIDNAYNNQGDADVNPFAGVSTDALTTGVSLTDHSLAKNISQFVVTGNAQPTSLVAPAAVPEPASASLALAAGVAVAAGRRKSRK